MSSLGGWCNVVMPLKIKYPVKWSTIYALSCLLKKGIKKTRERNFEKEPSSNKAKGWKTLST